MVSDWVPNAGDVIWIDFNPTMGRELARKRPALVLSPSSYNAKTGLVLACAITTQVKGYPFEVPMPDGAVVLADQVKCMDWRYRNAQAKDTAPDDVLKRVRVLLGTLLQI